MTSAVGFSGGATVAVWLAMNPTAETERCGTAPTPLEFERVVAFEGDSLLQPAWDDALVANDGLFEAVTPWARITDYDGPPIHLLLDENTAIGISGIEGFLDIRHPDGPFRDAWEATGVVDEDHALLTQVSEMLHQQLVDAGHTSTLTIITADGHNLGPDAMTAIVELTFGAGATAGSDAGGTGEIETDAAAGRLDLDLVEYEQFAMVAAVDPDLVAPLLTGGAELFLDENGMASLTHVSKTCTDIVIDGSSLGGGHFDTQWIRTVGPSELREVPELPDLQVLETDYFEPVAFVTDDAAHHEATTAFGIPMVLAESMEMDPIAGGTWTGGVELEDGGYDWTVDNVTEVDMHIYFVHVLEQVLDGTQLRYEILCPADVDWFGGAAQLDLRGSGDLVDAVGADVPGHGGAVELTCDVTIDRTPGRPYAPSSRASAVRTRRRRPLHGLRHVPAPTDVVGWSHVGQAARKPARRGRHG